MLEQLDNDSQFAKAFAVYDRGMECDFYRSRHVADRLPDNQNAWLNVPVLEKQALFDNAYPRSSAMLTEPVRGMITLSTGGSTGVARYTLMTHHEWDVFAAVQAETLKLFGVKEDDRVANLFVAGHLWPSFLGVHEIIKTIGAVHLPISANIPPDEIVKLCSEFKPTVLLSLPTLFVFIADIVAKEQIELGPVRMLAYAGEHMSEEAQKHVKKHLGNPDIKSLAYSSADAGLMGYQCDECGFGEYHVPTGFQLLEIIDPETGEPTEPGVTGDILVTNLARFSMPIIRYRLGDVGCFLDRQCACGDKNPLFSLKGRAGDDFKLGGAFISMKVFEESLSEVSDFASMNYLVVLEDVENQVDMRVQVESADPKRAKEKAETLLREAIMSRVKEIRVGLDLDYIRTFDVEFVDLGKLPRNSTTGKVKRLEDRRTIG